VPGGGQRHLPDLDRFVAGRDQRVHMREVLDLPRQLGRLAPQRREVGEDAEEVQAIGLLGAVLLAATGLLNRAPAIRR